MIQRERFTLEEIRETFSLENIERFKKIYKRIPECEELIEFHHENIRKKTEEKELKYSD